MTKKSWMPPPAPAPALGPRNPVKVLERLWSLARDRGAFVELRPYAAGNPHSVTAQSRDEPCDERIGVGRGHRHQLSGPPRRERPDHAREARTDRTHRTDRDPQSDGGELRCRSGDGGPHDRLRPDPGPGEGSVEPRAEAVVRRVVHERRTIEVLDPHGGPLGQWVAGGRGQDDLLLGDGGDLETVGRGSGSTATSTSSDSTSLSASSMTASSCRVMATFG